MSFPLRPQVFELFHGIIYGVRIVCTYIRHILYVNLALYLHGRIEDKQKEMNTMDRVTHRTWTRPSAHPWFEGHPCPCSSSYSPITNN